jgi:uncharacterized protein YraI
MRKILLAAAAAALATTASPALARQSQGYAIRATAVLAGPDRRYPRVVRLRTNASLMIYGCLRDRSWCDVGYQSGRGWVPGGDIVIDYRGRRRGIGAGMGISILAFSFGSYWDSYYRSQPFYAQRPRWEHDSAGYYGNPGRGYRPGQARPYGGNRGPGGWQQPVQPQVTPQPDGNHRGGGWQQPGQPRVAPQPDRPQPGGPDRSHRGQDQQGPGHQGPGSARGGDQGGHGNHDNQRDHTSGGDDHQPHP